MFRFLLIASGLLMILTSTFSTASAQGPDTKMKKAVQKIGVGGDITVVRSDGQWLYGNVEQVDDTSFTISEIEQRTRINLSYAQVSKVFKGYGSGATLHRDVQGHRIPPSRRHLGWLIGGAGLAALLIVAVVTLRKD